MICAFPRALLCVACLAIVPAVATAQGVQSLHASTQAAQSTPVRNDSKWNGALIGAGVGAVAGAFIGAATLPCSACAGFNVPLTFGVIGAGAGIAIGTGIDALLHQRSSIPNPGRPGRINISPIVGRRVKGVAASVRF